VRVKRPSERRRAQRQREKRARCQHPYWSLPRVDTINGERREISHCLGCATEREVEA
jgi:hypothetical protein